MRYNRELKAPFGLTAAAVGVLLFLHIPFAIVMLYAFTTDEAAFTFPPPGYTLKWFGVAWNRPDLWASLLLSVRVALLATLAALVLGTLAAAAVYRSRFFGREAISFLLVLPIALPGIVTGIALRSMMGLMERIDPIMAWAPPMRPPFLRFSRVSRTP